MRKTNHQHIIQHFNIHDVIHDVNNLLYIKVAYMHQYHDLKHNERVSTCIDVDIEH